jgi:autotransporter-associated beta strand protein
MPQAFARRILFVGVTAFIAAALPGSGQAQVTFDWATVGNPGNAADTLVMNKPNGINPGDGTSGYGAVGYTYRIAKTNVTNAQYVAFLNAVDPTGSNAFRLFNTKMADANANPAGLAYTGGIDRNFAAASGAKYAVKTGQENFPAIWINWASGARFVNWLSNGQGSGGTESGVYDMAAIPSNNSFATPPPRAAGATVFLPSENEWYKAAYYDPAKNGGAGGYWQYGTRSDLAPASVAPPGSSNAANIGAGTDGQSGGTLASTMATTGSVFDANVNYLTAVGAYTTATSAYGLYDLDGLVYNWTEATRTTFGNQLPVFRGGSWRYNEGASGAAYRNVYSGAGATSYAWFGFRIASLATVVTIDVASGTQTQAEAGYPLLTGTEPVEKTGAGILVLDQVNTLTGPMTVTQGTLQLATADALSSSAVTVAAGATLSVAPQVAAVLPALINDGLVDVGLGEITVVSGLTAEGLKAQIVAGRNEGAWDGATGITSSAAAGTADRAVGWIDNGDGSLRFGFAAAGDLDMNGLVDLDDVIAFVSGGLYDTGAPATWAQGDYDYNGIVDLDDVIAFVGGGLYDQGSYNQPVGGLSLMGFGGGDDPGLMSGGFTAVPEPATWVLAALGAVGAAASRRARAGWGMRLG